mmetsp:Transcript_8273/g.29086  ORF Transcript_8273/g.29086 Transcript_8273/m.29086 type:complete len:278 (+) Transcript_8273:213-1046(+)
MARSLEELDAIKQTFPPAVADYLGKIPDEEQYPATRGGWYVHYGSSPVESFNACMREVRGMPLVQGILKACENIQERFALRKQDALTHKGSLPPRVQKQVRTSRNFSTDNIPLAAVTLSNDGKTAMVKSTITAASYRVTFEHVKNRRNLPGVPTPCDKGGCINEIVCAHVFTAARAKGVEIEALMNPFDTTAGWKAQYAHSIELPSTADVSNFKHLREPLWRLSPTLKRRAGRPKKPKRHKGPLVEPRVAKRPRKMMCSICGKRDSHNKGKCPQKTA